MNHIYHIEDRLLRKKNCISAHLRRSAIEASTLELSFTDYEAAGLRWRDSVTLYHKGRVVYHGQVTSVAPSGSGRAYNTRVTVHDMLWQLSRLTLGEQLAELQHATGATAAGQGSAADLKRAGQAAMLSFARVAGSCTSRAAGWSTGGSGISVRVAEGLPSLGRPLRRDGAVSQWTALHALQQANPGSIFEPNYETGVIRVVSIFSVPPLRWDTAEVPLLAAELEPRWADVVSGVAVAVSWSGDMGDGTSVVRYPAAASTGDEGIRLFTAAASTPAQAAAQAAYIAPQLRSYYEAASRLQNSGTVTVYDEYLDGSMAGRRLELTGEGTSPLWAEGENLIAEEDWDLLTGKVVLSVGLAIEEPTFDELSFPEPGSDGWDDRLDSSESSESSADSTSGDDTTDRTGTDEHSLTLMVTRVDSEWDESVGQYLCCVEWETNKEADFRARLDEDADTPYGGNTTTGRWTQYVSRGEHTLIITAETDTESATRSVMLNLGDSTEDTAPFTLYLIDIERRDNGNGTFRAVVHWAASVAVMAGGISVDGGPHNSMSGSGTGRSGSYTLPSLSYGTHRISLSASDGTFWAYVCGEVSYDGSTTPPGDHTDIIHTGNCDCEGKWSDLENWKKMVEGKLASIVPVPSTPCACECDTLLDGIKEALAAAVEEAVQGAADRAVQTYSATWSDNVLMDNNSLGGVYAGGSATADSGGLSGQVSIYADYT